MLGHAAANSPRAWIAEAFSSKKLVLQPTLSPGAISSSLSEPNEKSCYYCYLAL